MSKIYITKISVQDGRGNLIDNNLIIATSIEEICEKVNNVRDCLYEQSDIEQLTEYNHVTVRTLDYSGESVKVTILDSTNLG